MSYVLTCSDDFRTTIEKIVTGLNSAGFSKHDMRVGEDIIEAPIAPVPTAEPVQATFDNFENDTADDDELNIDTASLKQELSETAIVSEAPSTNVSNMFEAAMSQSQEYNTAIEESNSSEYNAAPVELRDKMNTFYINPEFEPEMNDIAIPQFFIKGEATLFSAESEDLLEKEMLTNGFTLRGKNSEINFNTADEQIVKVDIEGNRDVVPKSSKLGEWDTKAFKQHFNSLAPENRVKICKHHIHNQLDKIKNVDAADLSEYIDRIINAMNSDALEDLESHINSYAEKIKDKIISLQEEYAKSQFDTLLEQRKIICKPSYLFPEMISPLQPIETLSKSLYDAEDGNMNGFEYDTIQRIASLDNVKWWHRVTDRKGFCINGFVNHYPDFLVMTKKGMLVAVETKGDHLVDEKTIDKLALGRIWQDKAGNDKFAYYMVYQHNDLGITGAYYLDKFMEIIKAL